MEYKYLKLAVLGTLSMWGIISQSYAMDMHVHGNQVFLSGDVVSSDGYVLADYLDRLRAQGKVIDTLVMRNSNGGSTVGGYDIGDLARRAGLKTVASGYCISACSMMFVGGVQRAFDGGPNKDILGQQNIQIHGMSNAKGYVKSDKTTAFYQYFMKAIADGQLANTDAGLLDQAFSSTKLAFLWDPVHQKIPSVYWGEKGSKDYRPYFQDDVYNTGFITQRAPEMTTDAVTLTGQTLTGNVNPNYANKYDPAAKKMDTTMVDWLMSWNLLGGYLPKGSAPVLSNVPYLIDLVDQERSVYNAMSPADRLKALTQGLNAYYNSQIDPDKAKSQRANPNSDFNKAIRAFVKYSNVPLINTSGIPTGDSFGIMTLVNSQWTLPAGVHTGMDALMMQDSSLRLRGGVIDIPVNILVGRSIVEGEGQLGESQLWANMNFMDSAVLHPTGKGIDWTGNPLLKDQSTLAFDIVPGQAGHPAFLRFGLYDGGSYTFNSALSISSKTAQLALHVTPGFYRSAESYALVGYSPGFSNQLAQAEKNGQAPDDVSIVINRFAHLVRADAQGRPVAGYDVDPTKDAFHPFDDSLVSFRVLQRDDGISLSANDAFLNNSAFCNRAGCGLGTVLSNASRQSESAQALLLGALQFSSNAQAAQARQQIEGAGYAAQRTASLYLINDFSTALTQHLRSTDRTAERQGTAAIAAAMPLNSAGPGHTVDTAGMLNYLVGSDDSTTKPEQPASDSNLWGRVFGHYGHLSGQDQISAWRQDNAGLVLGLDRRAGEQLSWGGSVGYGTLSVNGVGNGYRGQTNAIDGRLYLRYATERHYLDAFAGATHLTSTATRSVDLGMSQLPFSAQAQARYTGNALSLHVEHGWTLQDQRGWTWQPILPAVDVVRLPSVDFLDRASDPGIALSAHADQVFDTRVGAGLQVAKTFTLASKDSAQPVNWTPHARILVQRAFGNREGYFTNHFANAPQAGTFKVGGPQVGPNHLQLNVGVVAHQVGAWAFLADYTGDIAAHSQDHGLSVGARYSW
ncbi:autotransporter domain-containing protein [Collimonas pratensis]|uniref:Autotransporter beta-domain protein n=1 Tax=Collimonas pratensis TaxID=279113 RepID=A0A127Q5H5_9BURK|nr:autotransporter domain-containing protein [Collimonas pratensis]AMP05340.1 autotransporter beta-domain protein [Collimonas pratensis]